MPSLHLLTISAQVRLRLLSTRFLSGTDLRTCGLNVTDLRTCELNAGKTLRERDEPLAAVSTFNTLRERDEPLAAVSTFNTLPQFQIASSGIAVLHL
jgi:hypothetical protein